MRIVVKPSKVSFLSINWQFIASCYVPLFCAGLVGIYLKMSLMQDYWLGISRLIGQDKIPPVVYLEYFSQDVLVNFFCIPLVLLLLAYSFFKKRAHYSIIFASCLLIIFYFVQMRAQVDLGQYLSASLMLEAVQTAMSDHDLALSYIPLSAVVKLCIVLSLTVFSSYIVTLSIRIFPLFARINLFLFTGLVSVLIIISLFFCPFGSVGLYDSSVQKIFASFFVNSNDLKAGSISPKQNLINFREITSTSKVSIEKKFLGSEKGSNIIYFIMETGPVDVFPKADFSELLPKEILKNTLIANQQMTTYPYTSDAVFSILTGLYPGGRRQLIEKGGFKKHKVLLNRLSDAGYDTSAYLPIHSAKKTDVKMFGQFGVNNIFVADHTNFVEDHESKIASIATVKNAEAILKKSPYFEQDQKEWLLQLLFNDIYALEKMKSDIVKSVSSNKKFAYLYLPQIAHGPWFHIGQKQDNKAYGRELMNIQALWLQDIVNILKKANVLKNTVIVFTADHGIRTKKEDADLNVGKISTYTFNVPLAIYSPNGFPASITVDAVSSHIDIEPSMSILFGHSYSEGLYEGIPLWEAEHSRKVFFLAGSYGGANGFYQKGDYYMHNIVSGETLHNSTMDFVSSKLTITDDEQLDFVTKSFADFEIVHRSFISSL